MAIRSVGVVGCGLMGSGIAQTCTQSGYETVVREVNQQLLDKGIARIYDAWNMLAGKGKITQGQVEEYRARLHGTLDMADFADCDLVIEFERHTHGSGNEATGQSLRSAFLQSRSRYEAG